MADDNNIESVDIENAENNETVESVEGVENNESVETVENKKTVESKENNNKVDAFSESELRDKIEQELIGKYHARTKTLKDKNKELEDKLNASNRLITIFTVSEEKGVNRDILQKMEGNTEDEIIANAELLSSFQGNTDAPSSNNRKIEHKFHNNANAKNRRDEIMKLLK